MILKFKMLVLCSIFLFSTVLKSQSEDAIQIRSECSNINTFLQNNELDQLEYYSQSISPLGVIMLDLNKSDEYSGIEDLYPLLNVELGTSFELVNTTPYFDSENRQFVRYQQFHNGIKVVGGGYVVSEYLSIGIPCPTAFMLTPFIENNINVNSSHTIESTELPNILELTVFNEAELLIYHNMFNNCEHRIVWRVEYEKFEVYKTSYVDAHSGEVLKTLDSWQEFNAPTETYGNVNILDSSHPDGRALISPNGKIKTYNVAFPQELCNKPNLWNENLIPTTDQNSWTNEARHATFQAHHVVTSAVEVFENYGIEFPTIDVASCSNFGAKIGISSSLTPVPVTTKLTIHLGQVGIMESNTFALFDIAAHELAHSFIHGPGSSWMGASNIGDGSLHEGIADIIGTFVESKVPGQNLDWIIGDDVPMITPFGRDLENPGNGFFTFPEVINVTLNHKRSRPLGHWFYLLSEGMGLISIGIDKAAQVVFNTVPLLNDGDDYPEMREKMLSMILELYGPCSHEVIAVKEAWKRIKVGPANNISNCFTISGNSWPCEDAELHLYISNPTQGETYTWYFPLEWPVQGANNNSNSYQGTGFHVLEFPNYSYYPKWFTINIRSSLGSDYDTYVNVQLRNCDGPSGGGNPCPPVGPVSKMLIDHSKVDTIVEKILVCDILGRKVYSGKAHNFNRSKIHEGIYIVSSFNGKGKLIRSKKTCILNYK